MCVAETYTLLDNCCQDFFILECPVSYHGVKGKSKHILRKQLMMPWHDNREFESFKEAKQIK